MESGISFEFNQLIDLQFAEAFMFEAFPSQSVTGQIYVVCDDEIIGTAGDLSAETIKAIPQGKIIQLVGDFNDAEKAKLRFEVELYHASITSRYKPFMIVDECAFI